MHVVLQRWNLQPVGCLEHSEHQLDVIWLLNFLLCFNRRVDGENIAHLGEVLDESLLEGLVTEVGQIRLCGLLKPHEVVVVEVGLHQVHEGEHGGRVDLGQLWVHRLHVLDVGFVPVLQLAEELLLPASELVFVKILEEVVLAVLPNGHDQLLAFEMVIDPRVLEWILLAVDLEDFHSLEEHRPQYVLLVCYTSKTQVSTDELLKR